jgi:hypothetical protein
MEIDVPRENLVNVVVVTDNSWDNVAKIMRRIDNKCLKTSHRINLFYGKNMKMLQNVCIKKGFTVFRRSISNENYNLDIKNVLDYTKFCIIFHNFTEYNTVSGCIIDLCKSNCIPYFIISEHTDYYYFNGEYIHSKKFKNCIKEIYISQRNTNVSLEFNPFAVMLKQGESESEYEYECDIKSENSLNKFIETYNYLEELKKTNRTILIH